MDLGEQLRELQKMATEHREVLETEEAAKNALVMPFIRALGYNVFNPFEVKPEFTADVGIKKGEKVDYAICEGANVRILIECKDCSVSLDPKRFPKQFTQLYRYFGVTTARIAILTNGIEYRFFSDIVKPNIMDDEPFFVFNLLAIRPDDMRMLSKFAKETFDIEKLVADAAEMRTQALVRNAIAMELDEPSEEFIKLIAARVYDGRITQAVRDSFARLIPAMAASVVQDRVTKRLEQALSGAVPPVEAAPVPEIPEHPDDEIVTTQEEIDGFNIVRAICARYVDPARIVMRDAKSYCAILLDDNNRKSIVRMHFNSPTVKYLGTFCGKDETKVHVDGTMGLYALEERIISRLRELDPSIPA